MINLNFIVDKENLVYRYLIKQCWIYINGPDKEIDSNVRNILQYVLKECKR